MKLLTGIVLFGCLVAACYAAPGLPSMVQAYDHDQVDQDKPVVVDFWPHEDYDYDDQSDMFSDLFPDKSYHDTFLQTPEITGNVDIKFDLNPDNVKVLQDDNVRQIILSDLQQRISEDVRRMQEDFLLFRRLFNLAPAAEHPPAWFSDWGFPSSDPGSFPPSGFGEDPSESDSDSGSDSGSDSDDSSISSDDTLFGFPFMGIDRPMFPSFPDLPGVGFADPADLPDNYKNETHQVHNINGSEVHVNNTIHKESGDNFNTFFHHQVIHFKPDEDETAEFPEQEVPVTESPVAETTLGVVDDSENEIDPSVPVVENEVDSSQFIPGPVPEVNLEISSSDVQPPLDGARVDEPALDEEDFFGGSRLPSLQGNRKVAARSLREFNPIVFPNDDPKPPKSAAYSLNSLDTERDAEEIEKEEGKTRAPDLSNDTRVNRIHANKQGMTQSDPDAEIFNYELVLKEAQPRAGDM